MDIETFFILILFIIYFILFFNFSFSSVDSISHKLEIQIAFIENIDLFANVRESQIGSFL